MIPRAFEYLVPRTLTEAVTFLQQYGDKAKILAGGHSLIPMMKLRLATPDYLIDINQISELNYIRESDGYLRIGALTREVALEESDLIQSKYRILWDTTRVIADPQVRNLATVGGNLAHGDPANDHPATMLALGARLQTTGPDGERTLPVEDFFTDFLTTALQAHEILTEIQVPIPAPGSGGAYLKIERRAGDFATAGVAVQLTLDRAGLCREAGIGLTNVGTAPIKARQAEQAIRGRRPDEATVNEAAALAAAAARPQADLRGSEEYKRAMVKELTRRALALAVKRAKGDH
ncbi:MAG: FAD binding domain-containing protein [Acidobacteriota bacterium]